VKYELLYSELLRWMPKEPHGALYTNSLLLDMFFFMFSTGLSCKATSKALLVNGKRVSKKTIRRWMDLVLKDLSNWGQETIKWPTPEQWLSDSARITQCDSNSLYARKLFFFVDGSVIKVFDTSGIRISRAFRNHKHGHPAFVFFIMVTPAGRVVYVSDKLKQGSCHDKTHFEQDGVYQA
jgi:hypothetical protein